MREHGVNIPITGLKPEAHSAGGMDELTNLVPDDGYWRVPDAIVMPWDSGQLLRGRSLTFLVRAQPEPVGE